MRKKLMNQLRNLAIGEFAAILSIVFILAVANVGVSTSVALILLSFLLLQGSMYWAVCYYELRNRRPSRINLINVLKIARTVNRVLLIVTPVMLALLRESYFDLGAATGVYLFSIIEYWNYFEYRLSYGRSGFHLGLLVKTKWKRSSMNRRMHQSTTTRGESDERGRPIA